MVCMHCGAPLSLDYWRAFIRGIGAWKETFLLTIASVCSARLNGPWCIRVTCQAVINANRMKGLIKRDKCRHEQCRQTKRDGAVGRGSGPGWMQPAAGKQSQLLLWNSNSLTSTATHWYLKASSTGISTTCCKLTEMHCLCTALYTN